MGKTILFVLGAVLLAYGIGAGVGFMMVERISREQWWSQAATYTQISATALRSIYTAISVETNADGQITRIVSESPIGDADSILQTGFSPVDVLALAAAQTRHNVWLFRCQEGHASNMSMVSALDGTQGAPAAGDGQTSLTPDEIKNPYVGFARINGAEYFVSAIPIATHAGKQTGVLISSIGLTQSLYQTRNALIRNSLLVLLGVLLAATVAIIWLMHRLFRPVPALIQSLMRITHGDIQSVTPYQGRPDEIGRLATAIETLRNAVAEREQLLSIQEAAMRLEHMAHHDALTGLPNRAFLDRTLSHAVATLPSGARFNVMLFDLDRFKEVNDSYGHAIGDALLVAISDRLNLLLGPEDVAARLGGDEFVVVQKVARDALLEASKLASRIIETLKRPFLVDGRELHIGASVGITCAPSDGDNAHDLLKNADTALYAAKNGGRGRFTFYESRMSMDARTHTPLS
ncbi:MAG TPA: sensor domain-containing diguanylate cyclase [Bordetella sp.]